jgi:hypothetical protein
VRPLLPWRVGDPWWVNGCRLAWFTVLAVSICMPSHSTWAKTAIGVPGLAAVAVVWWHDRQRARAVTRAT